MRIPLNICCLSDAAYFLASLSEVPAVRFQTFGLLLDQSLFLGFTVFLDSAIALYGL